MSTSLDELFDEIFDSIEGVTFIDKSWAKHQSTEYRRKLKSSAKVAHYFQFDADRLTEADVVMTLARGDDVEGDKSHYRKLIDLLEAKGSGVLVFYNAHLMSKKVLHLLSRAIRSTRRQALHWQFIFFGNANQINQLTIDQLFVEHYYPAEARTRIVPTVEEALDQLETSKTPLYLGLGLLGFCLLAGFYFIISQSSETPLLMNDDSQAVNEVSDGDVTNPSEQPFTTTSSAAVLELIRESKLRDLEFKGMLEQIDLQVVSEAETKGLNTQSVELPKTETAPIPPPQNNIAKPLSREAENAIRANDLELLQGLLNDSELRVAQNSQGETPLIIATYNGHGQIVKWLLSENVPVNTRDTYGRTALFYASINGSDVLLERLLNSGAQVDVKSDLLKTPLMAAVHNNHYSIAETLLSESNNVNATDHSGWSALFYASWNSNVKMIELLLGQGADVRQVDSDGLTAKDIAAARGHSELLDML